MRKKFLSLALVGVLVSAAFPQPTRANPAIGMAGCLIGTVACGVVIGVVVIGGVLFYVIQTNSGQRVRVTPRDFQATLQDPEGTYDESITVYARSGTEAQIKCERAAAALSRGAIVSCLGCVKMTKTTGRYACTLRVEPY